eukprot:9502370-Pyramimonas_sp.AAC.1
MEEKKYWKASGGAIEAQCWEPWCYVAFWGLLGGFLGPLWIPLRVRLGLPWRPLAVVGLSWRRLGAFLGASMGALWALVGLSWSPLRLSWGSLGS